MKSLPSGSSDAAASPPPRDAPIPWLPSFSSSMPDASTTAPHAACNRWAVALRNVPYLQHTQQESTQLVYRPLTVLQLSEATGCSISTLAGAYSDLPVITLNRLTPVGDGDRLAEASTSLGTDGFEYLQLPITEDTLELAAKALMARRPAPDAEEIFWEAEYWELLRRAKYQAQQEKDRQRKERRAQREQSSTLVAPNVTAGTPFPTSGGAPSSSANSTFFNTPRSRQGSLAGPAGYLSDRSPGGPPTQTAAQRTARGLLRRARYNEAHGSNQRILVRTSSMLSQSSTTQSVFRCRTRPQRDSVTSQNTFLGARGFHYSLSSEPSEDGQSAASDSLRTPPMSALHIYRSGEQLPTSIDLELSTSGWASNTAATNLSCPALATGVNTAAVPGAEPQSKLASPHAASHSHCEVRSAATRANDVQPSPRVLKALFNESNDQALASDGYHHGFTPSSSALRNEPDKQPESVFERSPPVTSIASSLPVKQVQPGTQTSTAPSEGTNKLKKQQDALPVPAKIPFSNGAERRECAKEGSDSGHNRRQPPRLRARSAKHPRREVRAAAPGTDPEMDVLPNFQSPTARPSSHPGKPVETKAAVMAACPAVHNISPLPVASHDRTETPAPAVEDKPKTTTRVSKVARAARSTPPTPLKANTTPAKAGGAGCAATVASERKQEPSASPRPFGPSGISSRPSTAMVSPSVSSSVTPRGTNATVPPSRIPTRETSLSPQLEHLSIAVREAAHSTLYGGEALSGPTSLFCIEPTAPTTASSAASAPLKQPIGAIINFKGRGVDPRDVVLPSYMEKSSGYDIVSSGRDGERQVSLAATQPTASPSTSGSMKRGAEADSAAGISAARAPIGGAPVRGSTTPRDASRQQGKKENSSSCCAVM